MKSNFESEYSHIYTVSKKHIFCILYWKKEQVIQIKYIALISHKYGNPIKFIQVNLLSCQVKQTWIK